MSPTIVTVTVDAGVSGVGVDGAGVGGDGTAGVVVVAAGDRLTVS
jgi:hypothetical protein